MLKEALAQPGRNCWRLARADRLTVLVDAENYYGVLKRALLNARNSILFLGWEFDSRTSLVREAGISPPNTIGEVLDNSIRRNPQVQAHILIWKSSIIYSLHRELLTGWKLKWLGHRRLHFHYDDSHPLGASHHQKIVVIDDSLAFVGGLDVSNGRWDTRAHAPTDTRRSDPLLTSYPPFHDVMMMVSGPIARDLGDIARERWRCATGRRLARPQTATDPWPPGTPVGIEDVSVAIARTGPAWEEQPAVLEVEALHLDMIAAAQRSIYIECQYFASRRIAQALAARLRHPPSPEILIVSANDPTGLMERTAMGAARARLYHKLENFDGNRRISFYYPASGPNTDVKVHAKLMIVDDEALRIGSANLNNRSFGLDTECDLLLDARGDERVRTFIRSVRHDLLAEHLGVGAERIAEYESGEGLCEAVEKLCGGERTLVPLGPHVEESWHRLLPAGDVFDPERSVESIILHDDVASAGGGRTLRRKVVIGAAILSTIVILASLWRWAPLSGLLDTVALGDAIEDLRASPIAPVFVILAFLASGLLAVPVSLMIIASGALFGFVLGSVYALSGSLLSALLIYELGRKLGRDRVRRIAGTRVTKVSRSMVRSGIMVVATLRLVPVTVFTVVNLVAGASRIRLFDYVIGTLVGMFPVVAALSFFGDRLGAVLRKPDVVNTLTLVAVAVMIIYASDSLALRLARAAPPTSDPRQYQ